MAADARSNRLHTVDAVRALALFGVLVMNWRVMSGIPYLAPETGAALQGEIGQLVDLLLRVLLDDKSLSAFSFLFGLSFSLLLESRARQPGFLPMYLRRLLVLAGFGLLNLAFMFWGDILITYALLGLLLPLAQRLPARALLAAALLLLIGAPLLLALGGATPAATQQTAGDVRALAAFGGDDYGAAMAEGFRRYFGEAGAGNAVAHWDSVNVFGLFLLGLWTGRQRIPHELDRHRALLERVAGVGIGLGLPASLAWVAAAEDSRLATALLVSAPLLAVGYLALAALLLDSRAGSRARHALAPAGRVALTQYLLYGLLGQMLFYGWAVGALGHLGSFAVLLAASATYWLLLVASRAWLARFRYGPAEWLWRMLTYLRVQPLRRRGGEAAGSSG